MATERKIVSSFKPKYQLEPPEGGWGYVISLATAVMMVTTVGQLPAFGIIYGDFLTKLGDESGYTNLLNGIFNTTLCLMGLVNNHLLKTYSCRLVGIIGSISFIAGNFLTIFVKSLVHIAFTFGILQGIGFGLMVSAAYSCFNEYFIVRKNFMMAVIQTLISAVTMTIPYLGRGLMDEYGFQGTVAIMSALSLNTFAAMLTLQPVDLHMKKVQIDAIELSDMNNMESKIKIQVENNLETYDKNVTETTSFINSNTQNNKSDKINDNDSVCNSTVKQKSKNSIWQWLYDFLELPLLKDPSFVNIAIGVSVGFLSDVMFLPWLPVILIHMGMSKSYTAFLMTVYIISDLVARIILSCISSFIHIRNRYLFLIGTLTSAGFRFLFTVIDGGYMWITAMCLCLGALRSLIQVTAPLVLAEYSQEKFSAAYGLYLAFNAVIALIMGPLAGFVASVTVGDTWILHLLTILLLLCGIPWSVELIYVKLRNK